MTDMHWAKWKTSVAAIVLGIAVGSSAAFAAGDVDDDGDVDRDDIEAITAALNTPATGPDDPRDLDGDGTITIFDARMVVLLCTRAQCANEANAGPLAVEIEEPAAELVTMASTISVSGSFTGPVSSVVVNGVDAVLLHGSFTAKGVPLAEGTNRLVATALTAAGESASDSVSVRRDTDPPLIVIETPADGDRLVTDVVTVAGTVNDIIPGATVNEDDVAVTVNGLPAAVNNRTFILPDLPLAEGPNTIEAVVVDVAGNMNSTSIEVTREPDLAGIRIVITGGNNQVGPIGSLLAEPLAVELQTSDGQPLADRPVEFRISRGDGLLQDPSDNLRVVTLLTDGAGAASVDFTVGSRTGEGFHRVRVTTPGSLTFAEFCATAQPTAPATLSITMPPPRQGVVGQELAEPLSVIVTDDGGNPVPGVAVTFLVEFGGGSFDGEESVEVTTNMDGIAETFWTLGPEAGVAINQASADFEGNPGFPATFTVSGIATGPVEETTVSGVVQDSAGMPIIGARAVIRGTTFEAQTDPDGAFTILGVPPGGHHVGVLGSAANDPENGVFFPDIEFAIEVVSGADNRLDQIVVLPFLDMAGARLVGGDEDVVLEMDGVSGFAIKVFAHSTFIDGVQREVLMSSSQVKLDKVPMPPPQGSTPLVVGTLQPAGVRFNPPAQVIYPNVEGLAPGDVADIFAFHHDIGQFVNVGPGTVSEDGSVVASDPGFGIVQSGWHCLIRLPGPASNCANGCSANWTWQILDRNGVPVAPLKMNVPVVLNHDDPSGMNADTIRALIKVTFSPNAQNATFEEGWRPPNDPLFSFSATSTPDNPAAGTTEIIVTAGAMSGSTRITSPRYRIPLDPEQGGPKTCELEIDAHVATIDFKANPAQNYGYDEYNSATPQHDPGNDFISLEKGGNTTTVKVSIMPAAAADQIYFVSTGETNVSTVAPEHPGTSDPTLTLTARSFPDQHRNCRIEARLGGTSGPAFQILDVEVYEELVIPEITYYRAHDSTSPGTALPASPNPTLAQIESFVKGVWKQAVIDLGTVNGDRDKDVAYDTNSNEKMDFYFTGQNPELEVLDNNLAGSQRVVYVKNIRINYRLSADASSGQNLVMLAPNPGISFICPGDSVTLGPATGSGNSYTVGSVSGSTVTLTSNLNEDHPRATHTLYFDVAGLSGEPLLITDSGGEILKTVAHELLHNSNIGGLSDLSTQAMDNIMFFRAGSTDILLRKRMVDHQYSSGACGTGTTGTDEQWDLIPR